jgi:hypothetical protein
MFSLSKIFFLCKSRNKFLTFIDDNTVKFRRIPTIYVHVCLAIFFFFF